MLVIARRRIRRLGNCLLWQRRQLLAAAGVRGAPIKHGASRHRFLQDVHQPAFP